MKPNVCKILLLCIGLLTKNCFAQISIIPQPAEIQLRADAAGFVLTPQTVLFLETAALQPSADFFNAYIQQAFGFTLKQVKRYTTGNIISLRLKESKGPVGAYTLVSEAQGISITGNDETGVFYGL